MKLGLTLIAALAAVPPASASAAGNDQAHSWDVLQKMYPKRAMRAGEEGLVGFTVIVDATGTPRECGVTHSSGHALLDNETCELVLKYGQFKKPIGISSSQLVSYDGTVNWRLPRPDETSVPARLKRD